jgi:hypothetical protein
MYIENITVPSSNKLEIEIPQEMVGKEIKYLIFETDQTSKPISNKSFGEFIKGFGFKTGGYKFNREEANNYDEQFESTKKEAIDFFKKNAVDFTNFTKWRRDELYD